MSRYEFTVNLESDSAHARVLRQVGTGRRVLELGCASGYMSRVMTEQLGCTVVGIEIDVAEARRAERFCERVIAGDCETLDYEALFEPRSFDVLLFADVLEHLKRPGELLRRVRFLLAPGGRLIVSVPNFAHASVLLHVLEGHLDYRTIGLLDETHLRFFTRESVVALLEESGYAVDRLERQRLDPRRSEIPLPQAATSSSSATLVDHVLGLPESDVYQFIVTASPGPDQAAAETAVEPELEDDLRRAGPPSKLRGTVLERLAAFESENAALAEARE
nr:class I SAM-dependent methyltransferase [Gemmatimonadota bacterium]